MPAARLPCALRLLAGRRGPAARLPAGLDDLHGPAGGVVRLPRHLSWPGLAECDVTDDGIRRGMYTVVLSQGQRNDIARLLNARLLREDWPLIRASLEPDVRRCCERRFGLDGAARSGRGRAGAGGGAPG